MQSSGMPRKDKERFREKDDEAQEKRNGVSAPLKTLAASRAPMATRRTTTLPELPTRRPSLVAPPLPPSRGPQTLSAVAPNHSCGT
jgi:hypothetical protein